MFTGGLLASPPTLAQVPAEFKEEFGDIRYGVGPLSYQQWQQAYYAYLNPENDYPLVSKAVILIDDFSIHGLLPLLQGKFFIHPTLILHDLADANVQRIIQVLRENNCLLRSFGVWNDSAFADCFMVQQLFKYVDDKMVVVGGEGEQQIIQRCYKYEMSSGVGEKRAREAGEDDYPDVYSDDEPDPSQMDGDSGQQCAEPFDPDGLLRDLRPVF